MEDPPLFLQTVTVNRLARDNGHLGSLRLADGVLTFADDDGHTESVPLATIRRIEASGGLTFRVSRSDGPRLQIWMYDYFAHLHAPFADGERAGIEATTGRWLDELGRQGVEVRRAGGARVALEAVLFLVVLVAIVATAVLALLRFRLAIPIGLVVAVPSAAALARSRMGATKEAAHAQRLPADASNPPSSG